VTPAAFRRVRHRAAYPEEVTKTRGISLAAVLVATSLISAPSLGASEAHGALDAPRGYHTVKVTKAGFSIAVPTTWHVATHDPSFSQTAFLQVAFTDVTTVRLMLVLLLPTNSVPTTGALRAELATKVKHIHVVRTKIAGKSALRAVGTMRKQGADGIVHTVYQTIFLVTGPKGVLDFNFGGRSDGVHDKTVQTMIHSVVFLH